MFIGHFAVALAAKRAAPKTSLGTLFLGAGLVDYLWPLFLLTGFEHARIVPGITLLVPLDLYDYPLSHSLATGILYAAVAGSVYWLFRRYRAGAVTLAVCVFSHWVLDFLSHRPDLPLYPGGSTLVGLGLWNSAVGSTLVEGGLFIAGVWLYATATSAKDRIGRYTFWSLIGFLAVLYISDRFSPPPPDITVVAWVGLLGLIFVVWAALADRHREMRSGVVTGPAGNPSPGPEKDR